MFLPHILSWDNISVPRLSRSLFSFGSFAFPLFCPSTTRPSPQERRRRKKEERRELALLLCFSLLSLFLCCCLFCFYHFDPKNKTKKPQHNTSLSLFASINNKPRKMSIKLKRAHKVGNKKLFSSSSSIQTQTGVLSASQLFDPILLPRSFSTAEIGIDHEKDERRASQMRHLLRQFAQPKSEMRSGTGRDQRRKQVDAIYSYLEVSRDCSLFLLLVYCCCFLIFFKREFWQPKIDTYLLHQQSAGMQKVPVDIQISLEDYVNEKQEILRLAAHRTQVLGHLWTNARAKPRWYLQHTRQEHRKRWTTSGLHGSFWICWLRQQGLRPLLGYTCGLQQSSIGLNVNSRIFIFFVALFRE